MKSKFVFLIFFIGYIIIMFSNAAGFIIVGDEILLGLSLSALLMSLGDCVSPKKILKHWRISSSPVSLSFTPPRKDGRSFSRGKKNVR